MFRKSEMLQLKGGKDLGDSNHSLTLEDWRDVNVFFNSTDLSIHCSRVATHVPPLGW
jgi:hypothetical protein